jgi:hypothetical protein
MSDPATELVKLRELYPAAEIWTDGGKPAVFMPRLQFKAGNTVQTRDALLWPQARENYATRLFLSDRVAGGCAQNWHPYSICGRQWYACSWQGVPATLSWIEILANHLRAFR